MATQVTSELQSLMRSLLDQFKPGGTIEQQRFAEAERGGRMLQASLASDAISRGLGNVALGIPTQVAERVTRAKQDISADLSGQYMGVLSNLLSLAFQDEQAEKDRAFQREQSAFSAAENRRSAQAQQKMAQKQQERDDWQAALDRDRHRIEAIENRRAGLSAQQKVDASAFPALFSAGGYGAESIYNPAPLVPSLSSQNSNMAKTAAKPVSYGYGPMFGD